MRKYLLTGAILAAFAVPAVAATATTWYVTQDAKTHKCSVTSTKPDGTKKVQIGKDTSGAPATYKTKADATKAEKAATECAAPSKM
jgi:phage/plasmid primase-like uncharacterized protein